MPSDMPQPERATRISTGGRLSFRRRLRHKPAADVAGLPYVAASEDPPRLAELVPSEYRRVEIEVGPGKGAFMLAATEARPDTFLLGIEAAPSYALYAAERLARAGRRNALLLADNAKLYLQDRVDPGSVARLHVYFNDPWPKRRHRKRRFFTAEVGDVIARILEPGGYLLCSTDDAAYAGQICAVLGACAALARDEAEEQRLLNAPPGVAFGPTSFERKYLEERRIIRRYAFRRAD